MEAGLLKPCKLLLVMLSLLAELAGRSLQGTCEMAGQNFQAVLAFCPGGMYLMAHPASKGLQPVSSISGSAPGAECCCLQAVLPCLARRAAFLGLETFIWHSTALTSRHLVPSDKNGVYVACQGSKAWADEDNIPSEWFTSSPLKASPASQPLAIAMATRHECGRSVHTTTCCYFSGINAPPRSFLVSTQWQSPHFICES